MTSKTPEMKASLDRMAQITFGRSRTEALSAGLCVKCEKPKGIFADDVSAREYDITALCQKCQDEFYRELDDWTDEELGPDGDGRDAWMEPRQ